MLWKSPGELIAVEEDDSETAYQEGRSKPGPEDFTTAPSPAELVPANKFRRDEGVNRSMARVIRWQDHGSTCPLVSSLF